MISLHLSYPLYYHHPNQNPSPPWHRSSQSHRLPPLPLRVSHIHFWQIDPILYNLGILLASFLLKTNLSSHKQWICLDSPSSWRICLLGSNTVLGLSNRNDPQLALVSPYRSSGKVSQRRGLARGSSTLAYALIPHRNTPSRVEW